MQSQLIVQTENLFLGKRKSKPECKKILKYTSEEAEKLCIKISKGWKGYEYRPKYCEKHSCYHLIKVKIPDKACKKCCHKKCKLLRQKAQQYSFKY